MVITVKSPSAFNGRQAMIEPLSEKQFTHFATARALVDCANNRTVCRVLNYYPFPLNIFKGTHLGRLLDINTVEIVNNIENNNKISEAEIKTKSLNLSEAELDTFHKEYGFKIIPELTNHERYKILQLLYNYKDVFARDLSEVNECAAKPFEIHMHTQERFLNVSFPLVGKTQMRVRGRSQRWSSMELLNQLIHLTITPVYSVFGNGMVPSVL